MDCWDCWIFCGLNADIVCWGFIGFNAAGLIAGIAGLMWVEWWDCMIGVDWIECCWVECVLAAFRWVEFRCRLIVGIVCWDCVLVGWSGVNIGVDCM